MLLHTVCVKTNGEWSPVTFRNGAVVTSKEIAQKTAAMVRRKAKTYPIPVKVSVRAVTVTESDPDGIDAIAVVLDDLREKDAILNVVEGV